MKQQILNLVQGSDQWLEARLNYLCASEAPVIMGESKFMTRNQLLDLKKGWQKNPDSAFKKRLFEKGHENEDKARELLEVETLDYFPAIVMLSEVDGIEFLASFDGLLSGRPSNLIFEHKDWNLTLAENVRNELLEPLYYWQLEHQCLVNNSDTVLFMCSDGTLENRVSMYYKSLPERRQKLVEGWKLFLSDLEDHKLEAKKEVVIAQKQEALPSITCEVKGSEVVTNLGEYIPLIRTAVEERLSVVLESDQDFADAEAFVKTLKTTRENLKGQKQKVTDAFESYSLFVNQVAETDKILQQAHSQLDKAVKQNKEAKKQAIVNNAINELNQFCSELSKNINGIQTLNFVQAPDFAAALKGKRNFASMESAVEDLLAKSKLGQQEIANLIRANLDTLEELAKDHRFLFNDWSQLVVKENEDLVNLVKARIAEHEQAEAERKRQEQERIEREAKEKAEREAQSKLEAEEKRIRDEERAKVEAEKQAEADRIAQIKANDAELQKREQPEEKPVDQRLAERFAEPEKVTAQQVGTHDKLNNLMYALTKHAARNSFIEFLEEWGLSEEDYAEVKAYLNSNLGEVKTYL